MLPQVPILNQDFKSPLTLTIKKEEPKEQLYIIKENDSLTKIAEATQTTVERLWEKNTDLTSPDLIEPGKPLKIPQNNEVLIDRPLPDPPPLPIIESTAPTPESSLGRVTNKVRGSSSGNTYAIGFCTHYAKRMRPDLPNNLGNANTWYSRAAAQGFAVGYEPRVGAIGEAVGYMHVVYVTGVNGDGTIQISEQNYEGLGVVSSRKAPASEFRYIY